MRVSVPPKQRVHRILQGSRCFVSAELRLGRPLPKGISLSPGEECLGGIWGDRLESVLTDRGAYFRGASDWRFVAYGDIEDVCFPEKSDAEGSLVIRTSEGGFDLLRGMPELWTVGRYFMRCADDARRVEPNDAGNIRHASQ